VPSDITNFLLSFNPYVYTVTENVSRTTRAWINAIDTTIELVLDANNYHIVYTTIVARDTQNTTYSLILDDCRRWIRADPIGAVARIQAAPRAYFLAMGVYEIDKEWISKRVYELGDLLEAAIRNQSRDTVLACAILAYRQHSPAFAHLLYYLVSTQTGDIPVRQPADHFVRKILLRELGGRARPNETAAERAERVARQAREAQEAQEEDARTNTQVANSETGSLIRAILMGGAVTAAIAGAYATGFLDSSSIVSLIGAVSRGAMNAGAYIGQGAVAIGTRAIERFTENPAAIAAVSAFTLAQIAVYVRSIQGAIEDAQGNGEWEDTRFAEATELLAEHDRMIQERIDAVEDDALVYLLDMASIRGDAENPAMAGFRADLDDLERVKRKIVLYKHVEGALNRCIAEIVPRVERQTQITDLVDQVRRVHREFVAAVTSENYL
jgi:hypothetical protein